MSDLDSTTTPAAEVKKPAAKKAAPKKAAAHAAAAPMTVKGFNPLAIPDMKQVSTVRQVAGKNAPAVNLKDHPEFDGQTLLAVRGRWNSGETSTFGPYVIVDGFIYPKGTKLTEKNAADYAVTLMTGSGNVYDRMLQCITDNAFPVSGDLRRGGRAWFVD